MKVRIFYHDTDCGGVVYYANYLKYLEEARTEYLDERKLHMKELIQRGVLFVVARQEIDYKSPAFYGDTLTVTTWVSSVTGVKIWFENEIKNQCSVLIARAKTLLVCIDKELKPHALPEDIKKKITVQKED